MRLPRRWWDRVSREEQRRNQFSLRGGKVKSSEAEGGGGGGEAIGSVWIAKVALQQLSAGYP